MIPTQPGLPNPFEIPDNTWRPDNLQQWMCPYCQQWIGNMQYHNCQGVSPNPVTTNNTLGFGIMSEIQMYSDFKKLMKRDTLAKFRERFLDKLIDLEQDTPLDSGDPLFGVDAIVEVFDDVAKGFHDDNSV